MDNQVGPAFFDENHPKYKCCCKSTKVRTGASIIAVLKALGVFAAIIQMLTGANYFSANNARAFRSIATTTTTPAPWWDRDEPNPRINDQDPIIFDGPNTKIDTDFLVATPESMIQENPANHPYFENFHFASTLIYLLMEAVAVSCLFYALRSERPKFVIPQMALILTSLSLQLLAALLLIVCAAFGSESLVQMVAKYLKDQSGQDLTSGDVQELRRLLPFFLMILALGLLFGSLIEYWFFRVLKGYYDYLKDKLAFRGYAGRGDAAQACYVNGYHPMVEEASIGGDDQNKDMPPAYQEIVQQAAAKVQDEQKPPSYKEYA